MPTTTFSSTGNTPWYQVLDGDGVHVSGDFNAGTATAALVKRINGSSKSVYDVDGVAVTYSADFDQPFLFKKGDVIGGSLTAASTDASIDITFTGNIVETDLT